MIGAITMMRDEADVAYHTLHHMAMEGVEIIVAANNLSADGTERILYEAQRKLKAKYGCLIEIFEDKDPGYWQSQKMTSLAARAASLGATWIIPFDADELWISREDRLASHLRNLPDHVGVAKAKLFNHFCSKIDPPEKIPFERIVWRQREPAPLPKVAFRWNPNIVVEQGNHGVVGAEGAEETLLEVRHFPYRSVEQFIHKAKTGAAAYAATDLPDHVGAHWRSYGRLIEQYGEKALEGVYDEYYNFLSPVDAGLVLDPAPFLRWR